MLISRIKFGTRLTIGFSVVVGLMLCIAGIGVFGLASLAGELRHIVENQHPKIEHIHAVIEEAGSISLAVRNALLTENPDESRTQFERVEAGRQRMGEMLETLDKSFAAEGEKGKTAQQRLHSEYAAYTVELVKLGRALAVGKKDTARDMLAGSLQPKLKTYLAALKELKDYEAGLMKQARAAAEDAYQFGRNTILAIMLFATLLTGVLAYVLTRSITEPLQRAVEIAIAISRGDLTQTITADGRDEAASLLLALKSMQANLAAIVTEVRHTTLSVAEASSQLTAGNSDLSLRTEQQASTLEETASTMEEFSSTIRQTTERMRNAETLSVAASKAAASGGTVAASAVAKIAEVNQSAKRIGEIIGVIDGIAFQTNILALNAAVEAARAGEQGRGFAVVASEVRSLAQRSATAAKEIKALIAATQAHVETGTTLVNDAGEAMRGVVKAIEQVSTIFTEISVASREQSTGIDQIAQGVAQLEEVTQQNAALVEESAAAAESMREQATTLSTLVSQFKLDDACFGVDELPVGRSELLATGQHARNAEVRIAALATMRRISRGTPDNLRANGRGLDLSVTP